MAWRSGRWPSTVIGMPTRSSPRMEIRRAMVVASFSGEMAAGPKSESCARRGRSGWAVNEKPITGAPGGRFSRSRRRRVSIVFTSRVGAGRSMPRASKPSGSRISVISIRLQAKPCISIRLARRSSAALAMKRNGSSATSGHSSSIPSRNSGGSARGVIGRGSMPRAAQCSSRPISPKRLAMSLSGRRARSPIDLRPKRCSIVAASISGERRASGSGARKLASSPAATTVGDFGSSAATRAASLLAATPTRTGSVMASHARMAANARFHSGSVEARGSAPAASGVPGALLRAPTAVSL